MQEQVAAITRAAFVRDGYFQGFTTSSKLLPLVFNSPSSYEYLPRNSADSNPDFKQIIPYFYFTRIFKGARYYLAYTRGKSGGESRLHHNMSVGFGGHMNPGECVADCIMRECREEVPDGEYYDHNLVGFVNNDDTPVGKVHLGVVFRFEVDMNFNMSFPDVSIHQPQWLNMSDLSLNIDKFEKWSQYLIMSHFTH